MSKTKADVAEIQMPEYVPLGPARVPMIKAPVAIEDGKHKATMTRAAKATGAFKEAAPTVASVTDTASQEARETLHALGIDKMSIENVQALIVQECDSIKALLLGKNARYGNSALAPVRMLSKASPVEQILVRIDDKLSRLGTLGVGQQLDEDTVQDLIGYFVLLRIAQRLGLK